MLKIRISDQIAAYSECNSEVEVETKEDAIIYLWALAKQDVPQYGVVWLPMGVEPMTNYAMHQADPPASLKEKIQKKINTLNESSIEGLVVQGLNIVYNGLSRYANDPEYIEKVILAAKDWAEDCYQ